MVRGDFELLRQLRLTWDFMANTWNQWVLGYTPERQRWLLANVGIDDATWQKLAAILSLSWPESSSPCSPRSRCAS